MAKVLRSDLQIQADLAGISLEESVRMVEERCGVRLEIEDSYPTTPFNYAARPKPVSIAIIPGLCSNCEDPVYHPPGLPEHAILFCPTCSFLSRMASGATDG